MQTTMKPKGLAKIWREVKRPFRDMFRNIKSHNFVGPDQWGGLLDDQNQEYYKNLFEVHEEFATLDRIQIQEKYPMFWKRVEPVCSFSSGIVLEIGCASGNVTRWMNEVDAIKKIYCVDLFEVPIVALNKRGYAKAIPICCDITTTNMSQWIVEDSIDTIVLCEIIEHMPLSLELAILQSVKNYTVERQTKWVVSTPIGFMKDPHHCRGFSKNEFIIHLERYYGIIDSIHYNGVQQTACGWF